MNAPNPGNANTAANACPYCGLEVSPGARKCPHCLEWIVRKNENRREQVSEFVKLVGGIIGLGSTVIVAYNYFNDRIVPPRPKLHVESGPTCLRNEVIVRIEKRGRGAGYAPRTGRESMTSEKGVGTKLNIMDSVRIAPRDSVEVAYRVSDPGLQKSEDQGCRRTVAIGKLNTVECSCVVEEG